MQNQEVEVPVTATKTSSGMILETRQNNEVVNTVASNITSCQIPSTQSHSTQPFEESVAKLDQANGRVWNKTFYNLNINIFVQVYIMELVFWIPNIFQVSDEDKNSSRKPPYTYTELITQALKDKEKLTVSGIYNWIT